MSNYTDVAEIELAQTKSMCPVCLAVLKASIIERDGGIYLKRTCPDHGVHLHFISSHPIYYKKMRDYYYSVMNGRFKQGRYLFFLTGACNLSCPVCFYGTDTFGDVSIEEIKKILSKNINIELIVFGKEPTCRVDLPNILELLKKLQNSISLYTNGIKISDINYLYKIKKSGVSKIYLQLDGFREDLHKELRDSNLMEYKIKALENLRNLKIDTVVNATIIKDKNEDQVKVIFDYALQHRFIKAINFTSYIRTGNGKTCFSDNSIMPDHIVDILEAQTNMRINRYKMLLFQKFFYAYMSFFKKRTCFYTQYFWIYRKGDDYKTIDEMINLGRLEDVLEIYKKLCKKNTLVARIYILFFLPICILVSTTSLKIVCEFFCMALFHMFRIKEYSNLSSRFLQLIFTTACDPYKADFGITKYCHVGILYKDRDGIVRKKDDNGLHILLR